MKLLLQMLFVQGWLWRDRLPEVFAQAKEQQIRIGWGHVTPILFLLISVLEITESRWGSATLLVIIAASLVLWRNHLFQLDRIAGGKELWISVSWASGLVVAASLVILLVMAPLTSAWAALALAAAGLYVYGTGWLHGMESNYLLFADPANNAWRLEAQETTQKGFIRPRLHLLAETYWRLPRQISATRGRHHAD